MRYLQNKLWGTNYVYTKMFCVAAYCKWLFSVTKFLSFDSQYLLKTTGFNDFLKFAATSLRLSARKFEIKIVLKIETLNQALYVLSIFYTCYTFIITTIDVTKL